MITGTTGGLKQSANQRDCEVWWMVLKSSHLRTDVSFVAGPGDIVQVLPTGAQSGVHVGHLALHQLKTELNASSNHLCMTEPTSLL